MIDILMQSARELKIVAQCLNSIITATKGIDHKITIYRDRKARWIEGSMCVIDQQKRPEINIPEVQNYMIHRAEADICLLVDDEMLFNKDTIIELLRNFNGKHSVPVLMDNRSGAIHAELKNIGVDLISKEWSQKHPFQGARGEYMNGWYRENDQYINQVPSAIVSRQRVHSILERGYPTWA